MKNDLPELPHDPRLSYLIEHLDQGIWDADLTTKTLFVSKAWCDMRGAQRITTFDFHDDSWLQNIHPVDRDQISAILSGAIDWTDGNISIQYRYRHANGDWIWLHCRAKVMETDETGRATRIIGTDTYIDDFKRSAAAQSELTEKLQLAIDASGIGVWEFNPATKTVHWDDRFLEIYGLCGQPNEQPHTIWRNSIHPEDREATLAYTEKARRDQSDLNYDYRILRPDNEVRHLRSLARFVKTADGQTKLIGVIIDVTADYERTTALEVARNQLEYESRHDALTGLANRRRLDETLQKLALPTSPEEIYAVLHLDLDHFKAINDRYGHAAGDAVLCHTAQILKDKMADLGLVCRTGGDEFVVLLKTAIPQDALGDICAELVQAISRPLSFEDITCSAGVSIGVAYAAEGTDHAETFRRADKALYKAKNVGRGGVEFYNINYTPPDYHIANARHDIQKAISRGEVICHFQPQYDAETLAIVGAEALVRWDCPSRGLLGPDQFLPQAALSDVINDIDRHMLELVLAQQTAWHKAGLAYPAISLNIAKDRIMRPGLGDKILSNIGAHHALSFELLETAFIDTPDRQLERNLAQLRQMGILIELDDFGSGHSSVVALQTIKPDRIKIDRGLVAPIVTHPDQLLTLGSLSCIARLEGAKIVIEGLETGLHLAAIRNVDCDVLQGFGLHRPVPADEFAALLRQQPQRSIAALNRDVASLGFTNAVAPRRH